MRLRIIDIDGTPEEIASLPQLHELLASSTEPRAESTSTETSSELMSAGVIAPTQLSDRPDISLPKAVTALIEFRPPIDEIRELLNRFLAEVLQWPDVEARVGVSRRSANGRANAIRLHRRGSVVGAFVYLRLPAVNMHIRLSRDTPDHLLVHATRRRVGPEAPYGLALRLTSAEVLTEALSLARLAYEVAGSSDRERDGVSTTGDEQPASSA